MTILCAQTLELQSYLTKKRLAKFVRSSIKSNPSSSTLTPILLQFAAQIINDPTSPDPDSPLSPISPSTSPIPVLSSESSIDSFISLPTPTVDQTIETENLLKTLMHTVSMAWQRYLALFPNPPPSTSSVDNEPHHDSSSSSSSLPPSFGLIIADDNRSVIHVGADFELITGYSRQELIGKNAALLQGRLTSDNAVSVLRSALKEKKPCQVLLINYKKDGQPFWNLLTIAPFFSIDGTINRWFGIQMIANESWKVDRPLPIFPWTQYPLPNMHTQGLIVKKNKINKKHDNNKSRHQNNNNSNQSKIQITHKESINDSLSIKHDFDHHDDLSSSSSSPSSPSSSSPLRPYLLSFVAETLLPTRHGRYRVRAYRQLDNNNNPTDIEIMVIIHGHPELMKENIPVRVHDACFTSEVLHSLKCDCREQLEYSMKYIRDQQNGLIIYLPQEGRGIGLSNKIKAYSMQELGYDTVDANRILGFPDDNRAYNVVPSILQDLSIKSVKLLSNNTRKFGVLRDLGVVINGRIPVLVLPTFSYPDDSNNNNNSLQLTPQVAIGAPDYVASDVRYAENYVKAKIARMGHMDHGQDM